MARVAPFSLLPSQKELLEKWSRGGSTPYRLVLRSRIVLLAALGQSNRRIAAQLKINPITVARWRSRFLVLGTEGIRREAPRLGSPPRVAEELIRTILHKTSFERPPDASRWSTRSLARAVGVSHSTVRRVWRAYDVHPARSRIATLARDPRFHRRSIDVVGVYVNPPQRALAISLLDDRGSSPGAASEIDGGSMRRPAPKGRPWMADLVSTLDLLDHRPPKGSMTRLVDTEFLSFLRSVQESRRGRERIHLLAESAGSAGAAPLTRWLRRYPEFSARFQVGSAPLMEIALEWFGDPSARLPDDATPMSLPGLRSAVERWLHETRGEPRAFAWTRK